MPTSHKSEAIAASIREARKKNSLTQEELAKKLGVTFQAVSRWETGRDIPSSEMLTRISEKLEIPLPILKAGFMRYGFEMPLARAEDILSEMPVPGRSILIPIQLLSEPEAYAAVCMPGAFAWISSGDFLEGGFGIADNDICIVQPTRGRFSEEHLCLAKDLKAQRIGLFYFRNTERGEYERVADGGNSSVNLENFEMIGLVSAILSLSRIKTATAPSCEGPKEMRQWSICGKNHAIRTENLSATVEEGQIKVEVDFVSQIPYIPALQTRSRVRTEFSWGFVEGFSGVVDVSAPAEKFNSSVVNIEDEGWHWNGKKALPSGHICLCGRLETETAVLHMVRTALFEHRSLQSLLVEREQLSRSRVNKALQPNGQEEGEDGVIL